MKALHKSSLEAFDEFLYRIKRKNSNSITLSTAASIATKLTIGLMSPIYKQIIPNEVGEVNRSIDIAKSYAKLLFNESKIIDENGLNKLVETYPSHGFVIDLKEAKTIFKNVRPLDKLERDFLNNIGNLSLLPFSSPFVCMLSPQYEEVGNGTEKQQNE